MRSIRTRVRFLLAPCALVLALCAGAVLAGPQDDDAPSPADVQAMQSFTLDADFLQRYVAVQDESARDICRLGMVNLFKEGDRIKSLDEAARHYDAQPGVHAMLARHGVSARQMVLGMATLVSAAAQDLKETHPAAARYITAEGHVSAQNMAFYRAHKAELRQHMREVGKRQLAANGGKLPACLAQ